MPVNTLQKRRGRNRVPAVCTVRLNRILPSAGKFDERAPLTRGEGAVSSVSLYLGCEVWDRGDLCFARGGAVVCSAT